MKRVIECIYLFVEEVIHWREGETFFGIVRWRLRRLDWVDWGKGLIGLNWHYLECFGIGVLNFDSFQFKNPSNFKFFFNLDQFFSKGIQKHPITDMRIRNEVSNYMSVDLSKLSSVHKLRDVKKWYFWTPSLCSVTKYPYYNSKVVGSNPVISKFVIFWKFKYFNCLMYEIKAKLKL